MRTPFAHDTTVRRFACIVGVLLTVPAAWAADWIQQDKLFASNRPQSAGFGRSVSVSGITALVGAPGESNSRGSAYVFVKQGDTWSEEAQLSPLGGNDSDVFGYTVSLSGDVALIGSPYWDGNGSNSGCAFVFERANGAWTTGTRLTPTDPAQDDAFGWSVAVSSDTAIISAYEDDDLGHDSGSIYFFQRISGVWTQTQKLTGIGEREQDFFGWSVAIDGDTAAVGSWGDEDMGTDAGAVYVFERSHGAWAQTAKLTASDGASGDSLGESVSVSGTTIIAGTQHDDDLGNDSGSAYIFEKQGENWGQVAKLHANDEAAQDHFGFAVSVSGERAIVGAWMHDGAAEDSGAAFIFEKQSGAWTQASTITATDGAASDYFGISVSLSGATALIGAHFDDNTGSAYVFVPIDCTGRERISKTKCKAGVGSDKLKILLAYGAPGDSFTVMLDDDSARSGVINSRGKGKAKFSDRPPGDSGTARAEWGCGAQDEKGYGCP